MGVGWLAMERDIIQADHLIVSCGCRGSVKSLMIALRMSALILTASLLTRGRP
jgi:hypothetical protein